MLEEEIAPPEERLKDWRIFRRDERETPAKAHKRLAKLPLPPWRRARNISEIDKPDLPPELLEAEGPKARPFLPDEKMEWAVNAALYLRRPLLLTGKAGTGKSTLISKVAHQLRMGPVLRWDITSRSTVRGGVYEYDAIGRLQKSAPGKKEPPINDYLSLGPLGTALLGSAWPRALLIDEIDKGDLDLANDLLNVIEEGSYYIPELRRLGDRTIQLRDWFGREVPITNGLIECRQFPFVVMTSNAEREFPPPFLRRCVRLTISPPDSKEMTRIVDSHLKSYLGSAGTATMLKMVETFVADAKTKELATDQLLNAIFLTIGMNDGSKREFTQEELDGLRSMLLEKLA